MLDRVSGKIIHIDFGDCFEVAMQRDKYPEKIPFRLTRMLVNAMEVSGIEGNYRSVCELVMMVLREQVSSLSFFFFFFFTIKSLGLLFFFLSISDFERYYFFLTIHE